MKRPQWIGRIVMVVAIATTSLALVLWAALSTETGLRVGWRIASPLLPSSIVVDAVDGYLGGPLEIRGLSFMSDGLRVAVRRATIDWDLRSLPGRTLVVRDVQVWGLEIELLDRESPGDVDPTPGLPPFSLPIEVRVAGATIRAISLEGFSDAPPQTLDSLVLVEGGYRSEAIVSSVDLWGSNGSLRVAGRLRTEDRYPFTLEVSGTLRPPEPYAEVELEVTASGDVDEMRLDIGVRRPLELAAVAGIRDMLGARVVDAQLTLEETDFQAIVRDAPEARARATFRAMGPIDALRITGSGQVATPETGAVDFEAEVERFPDRVLVTRLLAVLGPARLDANGTIRISAGEPSFDGRVDWRDAQWPLSTPARVRSRSGSLIVTGTAQRYSAELAAEVALVSDPALEGTVTVVGQGTPESLEIDALELDLPEGTLSVDGRVSWQPDLRWRLAFRGEDVQPELFLSDTAQYEARLTAGGSTTGTIVSERISGSLILDTVAGTVRGDSVRGSAAVNVTGTTQAYRARLDAELVAVDEPGLGGTLTFAGAGTPASLEIDSLEIAALDGIVRAEGRVAWSPDLRWEISVASDDLRVGAISPDAALHDTRLDLRGRTTGERVPGVISASMTIDTLQGSLRGEVFAGSVLAALDLPLGPEGARFDSLHAAVERVSLTWQEARLEAFGAIRDTVDLSVRLSMPDFSLASPEMRGRGELDLRAVGPRAQPRTELTLAASGVALDGSATAPLLDSVAVALSGTPASHTAEVQVGRSGGTLGLSVDGAYVDRSWTGSVHRLELADTAIGRWRLGEQVGVMASEDSVMLESLCLVQKPSRACASGLWRAAGTSSAEIVLKELAGRRLAELLPPNWAIGGRIGARASGTLEPDGAIRADGFVDLGSGTIEFGQGPAAQRLSYTDLAVETAIGEAGARLSVAAELFDQSGAPAVSAEVDVALPDYRNVYDSIPEQSLTGFVRASVGDLATFRYAIPDLVPLGGRVDVNLAFSGTVAEAQVEGEARLEDGSVDVPRAGVQLRDIQVLARGQGADGIELDASVVSSTGTLSIGGRAPVRPTQNTPALIEVSGTRVQALNLPEASVWLSPDLQVAAWPDGSRVTGEVTVPVARIELTQIPPTAVRSSDDVIFVDDTTSLRLARALGYSVRVTLGDSITFGGFGFSAEPAGSLALSDGPSGIVTVSGDITLEEGRYQAYGQDLTMERGRLLFAGGAPDNPGLDIRASRRAADGTVAGLEVRGTAKEPAVTLFSEPAMMESQVLAYIVLGRPMSSGSESDGNQMTDAAMALGLNRGNQITSRLGQSLGLDEMTVEGGTLEEASLVAGAHLSSDLYVSYGVGLFEPVSIFRIRYLLSRTWTVRAETGKGSSADLLYRFERGR